MMSGKEKLEGEAKKSENTSKKVEEIIAVLRILFEKTSKKHTLKKNEIMDIAKKEFGVEIEQRRTADILNALENISKNSTLLKSSGTSDSFLNVTGIKFYRDNFVLSDDDINLILEILGQSTMLSKDEYDELKDHLTHLLSYGHQISNGQKVKTDARIKEFRNLKNIARKTDKSDNGARRFEINLDSITNDQMYVYPKVPLTKKMILDGFVVDIIDTFHDEPHICLLIDLSKEYRILIILPLSKVNYSKPENDWFLEKMKMTPNFLYGNKNKNYKDVYEAIEDYKQETNDVLFNFEIEYKNNDDHITESHDTIVKEALKKFYPSQYDKMRFKLEKKGFVHVKFKSTIQHFYSFYLSNIKLLGCVGLIKPDWLATKLCNYAVLMEGNNSRDEHYAKKCMSYDS